MSELEHGKMYVLDRMQVKSRMLEKGLYVEVKTEKGY